MRAPASKGPPSSKNCRSKNFPASVPSPPKRMKLRESHTVPICRDRFSGILKRNFGKVGSWFITPSDGGEDDRLGSGRSQVYSWKTPFRRTLVDPKASKERILGRR